METQTENQRPNNGQLIYVPHKDTIRLLEVYVKRSLSLNDGTLRDTKLRRKEKWVTMPTKQRRHSSDPSLHFPEGFNYEDTAAVSVEATYSYYEKVSQELERIVHEVQENQEEVKPLSDEEIINRIIALTKEQGDAIDDKLKDNPTLSNFFQRMPYSSFKKLADAYLENESTPTHNPPTVLPTAPELVKLALTYDFTAKIARLSKQNIGHITGLGNRYLQDRFEYKQACTDHPGSDSDS
ncbi:hypothetical protein GBF38_013213 [Nibea albiflora]|uniref:Uncharacterized protein n=1 Tax=Nibea albiflora TaxID=240163 RepID=A0ACB7F021_NIBAL|nr:hypothetical protein GBF38_013213 [Nibea albiflora]